MRKLLAILSLMLVSCSSTNIINAQEMSEVSFHADNEEGVRYYVLQFDGGSGFKDIREVPVNNGNYDFQIPYAPGLYRLRIHEQDEHDSYSLILVLKATSLSMVVTVGSNITLHIFSPKQQQVIASLFDIAGRLLNRATFGVYKETSEDIPKPAAGIYILQLQGMNELLVQKLKIL